MQLGFPTDLDRYHFRSARKAIKIQKCVSLDMEMILFVKCFPELSTIGRAMIVTNSNTLKGTVGNIY